jgi:hypothetical protein
MLVTLPHLPYLHWFSEVITYASTSQEFSWECSFLLSCFLTRCLPVGSQDVNVCWYLPMHDTLVVRQDISLSECQEKQTPVPRLFLRRSPSVVLCRTWRVCRLCFVPPWGITLLYIQRSCQVSWPSWVKWCSYISVLTLYPSFQACECWVCVLMWLSEILSSFYCFEI